MPHTYQPSITLTVNRCYDCGNFWSCEKTGVCPVCATRKIDASYAHQTHLEKRLAAQKSATTRAKRQRKGKRK